MQNEKKSEPREPLFTGDWRRDMSVSEWEKAAEACWAVREAIERLWKRTRKNEEEMNP